MSLPINDREARIAIAWLREHFGAEIRAAVFGPFTEAHIYAIACQETAYFWLKFIKTLTPAEILARCVLDASGDVKGSRLAFPRCTAEFRKRYGPVLSKMLIEEANKTRALQGWKPKEWVYCGYGIFQYDLQFIEGDHRFFSERQWHDFRKCLDKCLGELRRTYAKYKDVRKAIRGYNGFGAAAERYADNVLHYASLA